MIRIEERVVYITEDDSEFLSESEAIEHERRLSLHKALDEAEICYGYVSASEFAEWIIDNKDKLMEILK